MTDNLNRRAAHPAAVVLSGELPRMERVHHISTFLPHGTNLNGILHREEKILVSNGGHLLLPESVRAQFSDTANRARLILLDHGKAGFALTFTKKFPRGSNGR